MRSTKDLENTRSTPRSASALYLKQNEGRLYEKWPDRLEDEEDEKERETGVDVLHPGGVLHEPHDEGGDDHDHRAQGVRHHVQEDAWQRGTAGRGGGGQYNWKARPSTWSRSR